MKHSFFIFTAKAFLLLQFLMNSSYAQIHEEHFSEPSTDLFTKKEDIRKIVLNKMSKQGKILYLLEENYLSQWYLASSDSSTQDDNAMCLVTRERLRFKRSYSDYIDSRWFGIKQDIDNTAALQKAIDYAEQHKIYKVYIPSGTYMVENLKIKSGITLEGTSLNGFGTILKRINKKYPLLSAEGKSILSKAPKPVTDFKIINIQFQNNDILSETPMILLKVAYNFKLQNCKFVGKGFQMLLWEAFDSVLERCRFEWGGNTNDLNSCSVEIASTDRSNGGETLEYTNNIYFNDCVFESNFGKAIKFTGKNSNEIYFKNLKIESKNNINSEHISIQNATNILFNNCQLTSRLITSSQISIKNSNYIRGEIFLEFFPDSYGNYNQSIVEAENIEGSSLDIYIYKLPKLLHYTGKIIKLPVNQKLSNVNFYYPYIDNNTLNMDIHNMK